MSTWHPKPADIAAALEGQNPWHGLGRVPPELAKSVRRPFADALWRRLSRPPLRYQLVLGPRRVGKTVALYQTVQSLIDDGVSPGRIWFLRLDHPLLMQRDLGHWVRHLLDVAGATEAEPLYLMLDDVNYAADWDKWLKTFYDEQWPLRVVATSSSTPALHNRTVESGIGRWAEQFLTPYGYREFLALRRVDMPAMPIGDTLFDTLVAVAQRRGTRTDGVAHPPAPSRPPSAPASAPSLSGAAPLSNRNELLMLYLLVGGFPELIDALRSDDVQGGLLRSQQILRAEAVQRVTGMDIPQAFDIRSPVLLERLLYILAGQMCGLANVTNLAKSLELTRTTVLQYMEYLSRAFLIFALPNWSPSEESVQRRGRKVYFIDGAVRNAALQCGLAPIGDPVERGLLIENTAASHLFALSLQSGARLHHWRDGQTEVDLVFEENGVPFAVEVGASGRHHMHGLQAIQERYPAFRGRCFLVSPASDVFAPPNAADTGIGRLPLEDFLLAIGAQADAAMHARIG